MSERRKLNLKELDYVSGGRKRIGTWYVVTLNDGTTAQYSTYKEAVNCTEKYGGGTIEVVSGEIGRRHK